MSVHPKSARIPFTPEAETAITDLRLQTEVEYDKADDVGDEVARAAWSRTCEHAKKLALIYACSENHIEPVIGLPAVEWATEFAMHQTRRQLYLASVHVAENPFHAECLKLLKRLGEQPEPRMQRQHILKYMKCKAADLDQIILTLVQQGEIEPITMPTATKTASGFQRVVAE